ncbi:hypothetical protein [Streptomyces jeddahensis]|uniref:Uncharacterized protein n=1 Tax=Streptomyces jeddahensis TaxID=1716141 RepID=A0A177HL91_9ACTN|nr:hypothetical protein [Streptomyces jeddahensis]OAH11721.1 hypothetical protein STSP_48900 [Streptomyces jeddahensis]
MTHTTVRRVWTVELRPQSGGPLLACPHCPPQARPLEAASARSAALTHLAGHARADALPRHLRICQCRVRECHWHPRHRGCSGPVLLALTRDRNGRMWRLADACAACAAATSHTAVVPDTPLGTTRAHHSPRKAGEPPHGPRERTRVREMLTYLAAALPRFTSPAAWLLALQCALRVNARGCVWLPSGLLRGMRLYGRQELWQELAHTNWLTLPDLRSAPVEVQLLDEAVLDQSPGRSARRRAAHWALRPAPLLLPHTAPPAVQLTALVLAAYASAEVHHHADMEDLARLCGHSPHQTAELLDRLTTTRVLAAWQHRRDTDEILWQLPHEDTPTHAAVGPRAALT